MDLYAGIDCGGTHIRIGLFNQTGRLLDHSKSHSPLTRNPNEFGQVCKEFTTLLLASNNLNSANLQAIGVGTPGPIDFTKGEILKSANLNNDEPIEFKKQLEASLERSVYFDRDTNLALVGEHWQGAAKGIKDVIMLTLGTGVGGALMEKGQIYHGHSGWAGEIGHSYLEVTDKPDNLPMCGLGHHGCLESLIKSSEDDLEKVLKYLSAEIASLVDIFNPEMIVLGGGMMNKISSHLEFVFQYANKLSMSPADKNYKLVAAALGDLSGVYGAAKIAMEKVQVLPE